MSEPAAPPLLVVRDLVATFATSRGPLTAVDGVSFELSAGTTLGIVGESGSGKSALVRSIMNILAPNGEVAATSEIHIAGRDVRRMTRREQTRFWGVEVSMIFQDPNTSLNPVKKVGRHITEVTRWHLGLSRSDARTHAIDLLAQVGIPEPQARFDQYPHQLSGGMRQRAGIAAALACNPRLLIADEPTTALDVTVQKQILDLLRQLQQERDMGMILISHDLGAVAQYTDEVAVMYAGQIVESCATDALYHATRHPYTAALLRSIPRPTSGERQRLDVIPGQPPNLMIPLAGCRFRARCDRAQDRCATEEPQLVSHGDHHAARCHFPIEEPATGAARTSEQDTTI